MHCMRFNPRPMYRDDGTKITASLERVFRLRSCSEDDTILNECTTVIFGTVV